MNLLSVIIAQIRNFKRNYFCLGFSGRPIEGQETEAIYCAQTLKEAWKAHREAKSWLKEYYAAKG
jgi:hypothetical protein